MVTSRSTGSNGPTDEREDLISPWHLSLDGKTQMCLTGYSKGKKGKKNLWRSERIVERVSGKEIKTSDGKLYVLGVADVKKLQKFVGEGFDASEMFKDGFPDCRHLYSWYPILSEDGSLAVEGHTSGVMDESDLWHSSPITRRLGANCVMSTSGLYLLDSNVNTRKSMGLFGADVGKAFFEGFPDCRHLCQWYVTVVPGEADATSDGGCLVLEGYTAPPWDTEEEDENGAADDSNVWHSSAVVQRLARNCVLSSTGFYLLEGDANVDKIREKFGPRMADAFDSGFPDCRSLARWYVAVDTSGALVVEGFPCLLGGTVIGGVAEAEARADGVGQGDEDVWHSSAVHQRVARNCVLSSTGLYLLDGPPDVEKVSEGFGPDVASAFKGGFPDCRSISRWSVAVAAGGTPDSGCLVLEGFPSFTNACGGSRGSSQSEDIWHSSAVVQRLARNCVLSSTGFYLLDGPADVEKTRELFGDAVADLFEDQFPDCRHLGRWYGVRNEEGDLAVEGYAAFDFSLSAARASDPNREEGQDQGEQGASKRRRVESETLWHSSAIVQRLARNCVLSSTGLYLLQGGGDVSRTAEMFGAHTAALFKAGFPDCRHLKVWWVGRVGPGGLQWGDVDAEIEAGSEDEEDDKVEGGGVKKKSAKKEGYLYVAGLPMLAGEWLGTSDGFEAGQEDNGGVGLSEKERGSKAWRSSPLQQQLGRNALLSLSGLYILHGAIDRAHTTSAGVGQGLQNLFESGVWGGVDGGEIIEE